MLSAELNPSQQSPKNRRKIMNLNLESKTALVTGSGQGIGAATARRLASEGANIVTHSRNIEKAKAVADEIIAMGGKAMAVGGTLDNDVSAARIAADAITAFGQIDILVNNAGDEMDASQVTASNAPHWQSKCRGIN
jgi:3-oxoacyl-[acyl-carrier protein] reductase